MEGVLPYILGNPALVSLVLWRKRNEVQPMNMRSVFKMKSLLLSFGTGAALVVVFLVLAETGIGSSLFQILLNPGLLLAGFAGFGAHDIQAIALAIVGDILFYG